MRRISIYILIIFELGLIASLVRGIQVTLTSSDRVTVLEEEKANLEAERADLEVRYAYVQSQEYLDTVARDELHLVREGETVVIVPEGAVPTGSPETVPTPAERENWEQWWDVFFGTM